MSYDGDKFIGVDDAAIANGQPVDTWMRNRFHGNAQYLNAGRDAANCNFITPNGSNLGTVSGDRPWAALDWTAFRAIPVEITKGLRGFDISGSYAVGSSGSEDDDVKCKVVLYDSTWTPLSSKEFVWTDTSSSWDCFEFPFLIDRPWSAQSTIGYLVVWFKSLDGGTDSPPEFVTLDTANNIHEISGGTSPTGKPFEELSLTHVDTEVSYDVIAIGDNGSGDASIWFFRPDDRYYSGSYLYRYKTWLRCRSIEIQPLHAKDRIMPIGRLELAPCVPETADIATRQALHNDQFYTAPTLIAHGPNGFFTENRSVDWPADYIERFSSSSGSGTTRILFSGVTVPEEKSRVSIIALMTSTYEPPIYFREAAASASWDSTLSISSGDETVTFLSETEALESLPVFPAAEGTNASPFLTTEGLLQEFGVTSGSTNKAVPFEWVPAEGQLGENEIKKYTFPVLLEFDLTDVRDVECPIKIEWSLDYIESTFESQYRGDRSGAINSRSLFLKLVGYSIYYRGLING